MEARSIRIFMPDGSPTGLRTAEIGMSTVKAVACSRTSLEQLARRDEAKRTGVYILSGPDPQIVGRQAIYVGEGDAVLDRIISHDGDNAKDFFEQVILFVSKDENLTKAHVRWLESRLVAQAIAAKRATVVNINEPTGGRLPESDAAEMAKFLDQAILLAAMLGLNVFEVASANTSSVDRAGDSYEVFLKGDGFEASALVAEGEVRVRRGSIARSKNNPSLGASALAKRQELQLTGVLEPNGTGLRFTQDFAFGSPSAAACVVNGASTNGWDAWRLKDGRPLQAVRLQITKGATAASTAAR